MDSNKDYRDPPPAPLVNAGELGKWSLYRAVIAEFVATLLFVYVTVGTVIGHKRDESAAACGGVGVLGIAWSFGGMIFVLVYCTAGISGGHINPAVTFGLLLARKVSLVRAVLYVVAQCLGAICGAGLVKAFHGAAHSTHATAGAPTSSPPATPGALGSPPRSSAPSCWSTPCPLLGAAMAMLYHQFVLRAKALASLRNNIYA
ncbi:hypothetical protein PR202_gb29600 [Eleusine coracana subsp. coracana]|uniref:Uncharacterized protein n=1 Tax=Eleusine coracana subsp. coracana TaxID=191504 RepID=A0AAV5FXH2_ELECO|nr:hypothetical protein PR202_gb29600 [Eleusine coracana subsp. coracana]